MNNEFRVLTNANDSNLRVPIIQNRFRKLTLQSPKQSNALPKMSEASALPQTKLATEKIVNPTVSPCRSQTITNKLMLSTSSDNLSTQQTNFINVETEPFTNPLQVQNTENKNESPKTSNSNPADNELASQLEKVQGSRVSVDLFSQFSSSSKISLPPNRVLSNMENIENLSQRMSNIRMSDDVPDTQPNSKAQQGGRQSEHSLADTQPNISQDGCQLEKCLADTQPNTTSQSPLKQSRGNVPPNTNEILIVLSSDEDDNDDDDNAGGGDDGGEGGNNHESLLTEESDEEDSVIEVLSSDDDDNHLELTEDRIPRDMSPIDTQIDELAESVAQKLNNFFENIPKVDGPFNNYYKDDDNLDKQSAVASINISETVASVNCDENNVLELEASQLDENLDKSGGGLSRDEAVSPLRLTKKKDNTVHSPLVESVNNSSRRSLVNESAKMSTVDNESENRSVHNESNNEGFSHLNQSTDERQMSIREPKKRVEFEKIKASVKNRMSVNSPTINISARVNINIQISGFSSSSSDATSESAASERSVPNNETQKGSVELVTNCRQQAPDFRNFYVNFPNRNSSHGDGDDYDDPPQSNVMSTDLSVIESSLPCDATLSHSEHEENSENRDSTDDSVLAKELSDQSRSSIDVAKDVDLVMDAKSVSDADAKSVTEAECNATLSVTTVDTSVEIDEIGEKLLTDIYGDTWRTPQLMKKCLSTKKKCLTDAAPRRNLSRGFSLFERDVPSVLESTRITPRGKLDDKSEECLDQLISPTIKEVHESDGNQSSRIIRTRRKVVPNRILDYSDDDDDDDNNRSDGEASPNSSFEPSESDYSSCEEFVNPKTTPRRKRNNFVFLDLTCQEVIEDEEHDSPDASSEELEKFGQQFLQSLDAQTNVQTPAPAKKNVPANATKRKLFTPNYDDQIPFDQVKTPERPQSDGNKVIQLKTPIPSFLIPPQFRDRAKVDTEPITPTTVVRPVKDSKKGQTPRTPASSKVCGFMESLDAKLIPDKHCDPEALQFRSKFASNRNELVKRLMKIYNTFVFDNKLSDVSVSWSKKLAKTAGICRLRKIRNIRKAPVELSEKVLTSADRLRDTLIHELCHAAAWIIDADRGGHGKVWKYWADRANQRFPELPKIKRCHNYEIAYKYTYKCTVCGLKSQSHSKSKKVETCRCSKCHGPIELFSNKRDKDGIVTLVPMKEPSVFAKFVKENYKLHKVAGCGHADVMKILSNNFGQLTVQEKAKYKN